VLDGLVRSYKGKEEDFAGFQREYGISVSDMSSSGECSG
jgi:hypothetical protein